MRSYVTAHRGNVNKVVNLTKAEKVRVFIQAQKLKKIALELKKEETPH